MLQHEPFQTASGGGLGYSATAEPLYTDADQADDCFREITGEREKHRRLNRMADDYSGFFSRMTTGYIPCAG